ncbi:MAG: 2-oxo acid dehydrogenase subunit E2 [Verrucomicrobia bacterium]|nr:2-oxo acid dehydrogenase subunit E2 [Verrucomicrobiota bacterium]
MSEEIKVLLPKLGESIHSATIVQWFKKQGDKVHLDEPLLEVSTDKVNSEIPSPAAGVVKEIHAHPEQELQVGDLIAVIASTSAAQPTPSAHTVAAPAAEEGGAGREFFSPALLRLARENGISVEALSKMPGTGMGGRVTRRDLEAYLENRSKAPKPCPLKAAPVAGTADVERLKMSGMRKAIADNMVRSFYEAPHATLVTEVDVTQIVKRIQQEKDAFFQKHGCKLTITSFVAHAIAKALQDFPLINSSLEGDTILVKRFVNIGIAVSVDNGLLVPVVKQCQSMEVEDLAKAIHTLSTKARSGKLAPDDVNEGTITLTNFGMSGVHIGVPIIRYPEVAIVGIGALHKRVVPLEDDLLAVRSMINISLTFDHRVLDGMYGCGFLGALKKHLELPLS